MSKMDDLRAMREARYAALTARTKAAGGPAKRPPVAPPAATPAKAKAPAKAPAKTPAKAPAAASTAVDGELCGHRNMSGRTCTREQGHAAKSHRYG